MTFLPRLEVNALCQEQRLPACFRCLEPDLPFPGPPTTKEPFIRERREDTSSEEGKGKFVVSILGWCNLC